MADVFEDKAQKYYNYVQPDSELKRFLLQRIIFESSQGDIAELGIQNFPDLIKGERLLFPTVDAESDLITSRAEAAGAKVERRELNDNEKARLAFCIEVLKMPILLATHLAINIPEVKLEDFVVPDVNGESTVIAMIHGRPRTGKSIFLATMNFKFGYEVFTLDQFSPSSPMAYINIFKEKGLKSQDSYEKFLEAVKEFNNSLKKAVDIKPVARTMGSVLDELVDKFRDRHRPKILLIEGVASHGPGEMSVNIYHLISKLSGEASVAVGDASTSATLEKAISNYFDLEPFILEYGREVKREFLEKVKRV